MNSISGVIFDMDGVLCDSEAFICEAAMAMFKQKYNLDVAPDDFLPFVGCGENRYLGGVAQKHGKQLNLPDDKVLTYRIYLQKIRNRLRPLSGVTDFITRCRNAGLKLAVASSADTMKVNGNLAEIRLPHDTFDAVVTGNDVTRHKPDPQCFVLASEKIGISPHQCLVVEDANSGCRAAKSANAMCLGITTSFTDSQLKESGADWTAADLASIPAELARMLGIDTPLTPI